VVFFLWGCVYLVGGGDVGGLVGCPPPEQNLPTPQPDGFFFFQSSFTFFFPRFNKRTSAPPLCRVSPLMFSFTCVFLFGFSGRGLLAQGFVLFPHTVGRSCSVRGFFPCF